MRRLGADSRRPSRCELGGLGSLVDEVRLQLIAEKPAEELMAPAQAPDELGFYARYSADEIYHKDAGLLLVARRVGPRGSVSVRVSPPLLA